MKHTIRNILLGALLAIGLGAPYLQAADVAISALPTGSALAGTEPIPMVQGAATKKTTPADLSTYLLSGSATTEVLANNAGAFDGDSGFTFNATNNTVDLGGATLTASDPVLDLSQTWNNAGVTFTGLKFNVTNTASAAASMFADFQLGGSSIFYVTRAGDVRAPSITAASTFTLTSAGLLTLNAGVSGIDFRASSNARAYLDNTSFRMASNGAFGFSSTGTPSVAADVLIARDAAGVLAQRNTTNAQTFRVYDTYTDASNYGRIALNTSLTGDWVQVAAETAGTGGDNYGIALTPTGSGAISAQVPDSTAAGGNARGGYAVDWQTNRDAASKVASGTNSVIGGGSINTASATNTVVAGGSGNVASGNISGVASGGLNTASGVYSFVGGGNSNTASGENSWIPGGSQALTRGLRSAYAYSAGQRAAQGDAQVIGQPVRRTTTDATPVSLATDGTPAATTVMVLPASSTLMCSAMVVAQSASAANNAGYEIKAVIQRDGSNNTALVGTATTTTVGEDTAGMDTTIIANDTLESAEIQVTGVAATTIQWAGELKCVQVL